MYGVAHHDQSIAFLQELSDKISSTVQQVLLRGDFSLIREAGDKNSDNIDFNLITQFNDFIADNALRELRISGSKYTGTNKQIQLVRVTLDRMLAAIEWEDHFPLCTLRASTRIGLDHNPLILDTGENNRQRSKKIIFER